MAEFFTVGEPLLDALDECPPIAKEPLTLLAQGRLGGVFHDRRRSFLCKDREDVGAGSILGRSVDGVGHQLLSPGRVEDGVLGGVPEHLSCLPEAGENPE